MGRTRIWRRVVTYLVVIGLGTYVVLGVAARLWYPRALFPAPRLDAVPPHVDAMTRAALGPKLLDLAQAAGGPTRALHFAAPAGGRTVVLFHGNAETMFDEVDLARALGERGMGALLVEYRGYGITYGPPPSEASLYADGEAALRYLADAGVKADDVALWGTSLGTSVAAEMAHRGHGARLVLLAPFTSVVDMGKRLAPIYPVRLIMAHHLDTIAKAPSIRQPTLVVHGDEDEIVPFDMGESVSAAIPGARFVRVRGGHHNDLLGGGDGAPNAREVLDAIFTHLAAR